MTGNHSVDLFVYGLLVIGLNLVTHRIAPGFAGGMLIPLVAGGVLIMLLGVAGLRRSPKRCVPLVTLSLVAALLMVQAGRAWFAVKSGVDGMKPVAAILSLLLFFAITQLVDLGKSQCHSRSPSRRSAGSTTKDEGQKQDHPRLDE